MELEAANGQRVLASLVFAHALRYFKDCCLKELNEQLTVLATLAPEDIHWVITVPAIWRQSAKQFMRHAATQVGCYSNRLQHIFRAWKSLKRFKRLALFGFGVLCNYSVLCPGFHALLNH